MKRRQYIKHGLLFKAVCLLGAHETAAVTTLVYVIMPIIQARGLSIKETDL